METSKLWVMRYRAGVRGATQGFIKATDEPTAMLVGMAYCEQNPGYRFITVEKPILADESILKTAEEARKARPLADLPAKEVIATVDAGLMDAADALEEERRHANRASVVKYLEAKVKTEAKEVVPA